MLTSWGSGLAASNQLVPNCLMRLLSMAFFGRKKIAPLTSLLMIRKNVDLKLVLKLIFKQQLNYDGFDNALHFYFKKARANTREDYLVRVWGSWYEVLTNKKEVDKDEAESHIIASFVILTLQLPSFLALTLSNVVLIGIDLYFYNFCKLMKNFLIR